MAILGCSTTKLQKIFPDAGRKEYILRRHLHFLLSCQMFELDSNKLKSPQVSAAGRGNG